MTTTNVRETVPPADADSLTPSARRGIVAACIGNFLEWYEFVLYGYFAAVFAVLFFPNDDPAVAMMMTFLVFGISFFVRPLGGVVFGYIGDRYGRKVTLSAIILMISLATAAMALVPPYASIGVLAPICILLLRCLQGLSAGGEWMGAAAYVVESAPAGRRAFFGSWQTITIVLGMAVAASTSFALSALLSPEALLSWGWRIPFLAALPLGLIGLYIRLKLEESPEFSEARAEAAGPEKSPLMQAIKQHWRSILLVTALVCAPTMCTYVLLIYLPTLLTETLGVETAAARGAILVSMLILVALVVVFARLCDRFGRRPFILAGAMWVLVAAVPGFILIHQGSLFAIIAGVVLILIGDAMMLAPQPALFCELFPTTKRYSGLAIGYNLGVMIFGGAGPFVAATLVSLSGSTFAPSWYLMVGAAISLAGAWVVHETLGVSLRTGRRQTSSLLHAQEPLANPQSVGESVR
ncbi:MFS transporter [Hoyosella sp. YIM 151337]|uniref:MFS transporter n=1 Tax=Hoyosella sp. YIM 151337 TaxID=2992742 RepID=UPI002236A7A1|nr:MFS transporter [Hoyosella sp. YIM 151337]MCW4354696.1 MFS transporter [Hoyosella sp. YIM 151337]